MAKGVYDGHVDEASSLSSIKSCRSPSALLLRFIHITTSQHPQEKPKKPAASRSSVEFQKVNSILDLATLRSVHTVNMATASAGTSSTNTPSILGSDIVIKVTKQPPKYMQRGATFVNNPCPKYKASIPSRYSGATIYPCIEVHIDGVQANELPPGLAQPKGPIQEGAHYEFTRIGEKPIPRSDGSRTIEYSVEDLMIKGRGFFRVVLQLYVYVDAAPSSADDQIHLEKSTEQFEVTNAEFELERS